MTYYRTSSYYCKPEVKSFTFTAISESALGLNVGCGTTFTMPTNADVCITVKDDDRYLSGDSCYDDKANDWSYQTAAILQNETDVGNGGQIYAEQYFWVKDQAGNWYVMIEVEQEGTNDDYFTFYTGGDYGVPPAGVELTVYSKCNVTSNWLDYDKLGSGDCPPPTGSISGTVFCDTQCDGINGEFTVVPGETYVVEAEDMYDYGFKTVCGSQASGGELVKLECNSGKLKTFFDGTDGTYDFKLTVQDENDGQSKIYVKVNGVLVDVITLDRDSDGGGDDNGGFSDFVIEDLELKHGDKVEIYAYSDCNEFVRIDKIAFEGQDKVEHVPEPVKEGVVIKLLDLDGNVIAETETDASGNYSFGDVPVGDYRIMGVAPDGTEFTIQDVAGNSKDDIDSDVDANGLSGVITVTAGSASDVDLGVCEKPEPGAVSGRYFCDTDDNDLDDGESEPPVPGVLVILLDETGAPAVDIDGNPVTSVFTDANGEYRFDNLAAGTYTVVFDDVNNVTAGKELVAPNEGIDDTIDSDAIGTNVLSRIDGIVVAEGGEAADNDAGVRYSNQSPDATPDAGHGCADEEIRVDLADNVSDPDGDPVTITAVEGVALTDGGPAVNVGGVFVRLEGKELVFDGEAAYAPLDIGEQDSAIFTYTIDDGKGGTAVSTVEVTFCGDANSVGSFCDSLPEQIEYQIRTSSVDLPYGDEAFDIKFTSTDARFDGVVFEDAYCISPFDPADASESFDTASLYTADVFCFDEVPSDVFNANQISIANGKTAMENLDVVNWILNQDFKSQGFSDWEIQRAIWELTDNIDTDYTSEIDPAFGDDANVDTLVALALEFDANKTEEYVPGEGDIIGVIIDPNPASGSNSQPFIIGVSYEDYDCLC